MSKTITEKQLAEAFEEVSADMGERPNLRSAVYHLLKAIMEDETSGGSADTPESSPDSDAASPVKATKDKKKVKKASPDSDESPDSDVASPDSDAASPDSDDSDAASPDSDAASPDSDDSDVASPDSDDSDAASPDSDEAESPKKPSKKVAVTKKPAAKKDADEDTGSAPDFNTMKEAKIVAFLTDEGIDPAVFKKIKKDKKALVKLAKNYTKQVEDFGKLSLSKLVKLKDKNELVVKMPRGRASDEKKASVIAKALAANALAE